MYADQVGIPTVGWGHAVLSSDGLNLGNTIGQSQADYFFDRDTGSAIGAANRLIPFGSTQGQFDASVSLIFNVGQGAFAGSQALRAWRAGDYGSMNIQWMDFNRAGGQVSNGLTQRRAGELKMFYPYQDHPRDGR